MGEKAHVKAARDTRMKYVNIRHRAVQMMEGWDRSRGGEERGQAR